MDERALIFDWNTIDYDISRDSKNHPHGIWFDDETLRDGLQSPSARNPTISQKIELLTYMEKLGIQKVDLGLPGAGPFHLEHIDAMLSHIDENNFSIRPGAAVRTFPFVNPNSDTLQVGKSAYCGVVVEGMQNVYSANMEFWGGQSGNRCSPGAHQIR